MKNYREIEFGFGSIEEAVKELKSHKDLVKGTFNGQILYSDIDDIDSAYKKITGSTKAEFDKARRLENVEYKRQQKEHKEAMPKLSENTSTANDYNTYCAPLILDACCGSRMFWFDKSNPNCLFIDIRSETLEVKDSSQKSGLRTIKVKPDLIADFTEMPFEDEKFAMVVFDPPHFKTLGQNSWMAKKYGKLPNDWEYMIAKGFDECMRVLKPHGTLIFKWNEHEIKTKQVLDLIPYKPLFGHTSGKQAKTIWIAFMKGVS